MIHGPINPSNQLGHKPNRLDTSNNRLFDPKMENLNKEYTNH